MPRPTARPPSASTGRRSAPSAGSTSSSRPVATSTPRTSPAPTLDSPEGRQALEFTASFFERGWVPGSTSTKAATYPDSLFTSGTLGMLYAGNFLLPAFAETIKDRFEYAVTYLPRDRAARQRARRQRARRQPDRDQPRPGRRLPGLHGGAGADARLLRGGGAAADPDLAARPAPRLRGGRRPDAGLRRPGDDHRGPRRRRRHHRHLRRGQPRARQRAGADLPRRSLGRGHARRPGRTGRRVGSPQRGGQSHECPDHRDGPTDPGALDEAPAPAAPRRRVAAGR